MLYKNTRALRNVLAGLVILASTATAPMLAKDKAEKRVPPRAIPVEMGAEDLEKAIFGGGDSPQAECTADCGNGSGWTCTGASVSCTDGVGCTGSTPGFGTARGECDAS